VLVSAHFETLGAAGEMPVARGKQERHDPRSALLKLLNAAVWSCLVRLDQSSGVRNPLT
jgi:hypothetical protein